MDKNRKLKRYNRKDYTQLVDFPVEIVGRDGVVRRYSFEESVRLYQRRIASASSRYPDMEVAVAEMRHCKLRIEQLRRSYFARYGWTALEGARDGVGPFAGEVAAFLRRCLVSLDGGTPQDPERYALSQVGDDEHRQIFYAHPRSAGGSSGLASYLLYFYAFPESGEGAARESFFAFLKALQSVQGGSETVEGLVAFHHSADCGLILTGKGGEAAVSRSVRGRTAEEALLEEPSGDLLRPDLLHRGLSRLQEGDLDGALHQFTCAYEANNYRRGAYIGAAALAEQLGRYAAAEMSAMMGTHYFPDDQVLRYFLAVNRLRQGNGEGAAEALRDFSTEPSITPFARQVLDALIALRCDEIKRGRRLLLSARPDAAGKASSMVSTQRWVRAQLAARGLLQGAALLLAGVMATGAVLWTWWLLIPALLAAMLIPAIHSAWKRQFQRLLSVDPTHGLRLVEPSALQAITQSQKRLT